MGSFVFRSDEGIDGPKEMTDRELLLRYRQGHNVLQALQFQATPPT